MARKRTRWTPIARPTPARTDAYAAAYGLKGWYRYVCDFGAPELRHRVQVNFLRTFADGDRNRFYISRPSPLAWPDRNFIVIDRDTGKIAFRSPHSETARAWVQANESGRVLIGTHGATFCLCANDAAGEGFVYVDRDGSLTGSAGPFEYLVCLSCRRHVNAATGEVLGDIDRATILAGTQQLYSQPAPPTDPADQPQ